MWVYGKRYIEAAALWRVAWYVGAGIASTGFVFGGVIDWPLCVSLTAGLACGSYGGTRYGLRRGERWVRAFIIAVLLTTSLWLFF